jgi:hypothetical protein
MAIAARPADPERIACEVCLKEIPRSEATMSEAADYVAYFCGLACFEQWKSQTLRGPKPGNEN